jgi:hypothetical protein
VKHSKKRIKGLSEKFTRNGTPRELVPIPKPKAVKITETPPVKEPSKEVEKTPKENIKLKKIKPEDILSYDKVEAAIRASGGWLSHTAKMLECPVEVLKVFIKRNKKLRQVLFEVKDSTLDEVEDIMLQKIRDKADTLLLMFYLKCQGQQRGWVDKPEKIKNDNRPIHIKITPAIPIAGNGRKLAEVKILPSLVEPKDDIINKDDIVDVEYSEVVE